MKGVVKRIWNRIFGVISCFYEKLSKIKKYKIILIKEIVIRFDVSSFHEFFDRNNIEIVPRIVF